MSYIKESTLDRMIQKQIKYWESYRKILEKEPEKPRPFLTISRLYGCNALEIAAKIANELNRYEKTDQWSVYDKELIDKIVEDHKISQKLIQTIDTKKRAEMNELLRTMITDYPPQVTIYKKLVKTIRSLSIHGRAIIVGRAGAVITRDLKYGMHIKFVAPMLYRTKQIMELNRIRDKFRAEKLVLKKDRERHDFLTQYVRFQAYNPESYDLTINVERFSDNEISTIIIGAMKAKKLLPS